MKTSGLSIDRREDKQLLKVFIIGAIIVAAIAVLLLWAVLWAPKEPVAYQCVVDTAALGEQPVDLCAMIPEKVRERGNVVITGGITTFPTTVRTKENPDTVYYATLTSWQQVKHLVDTPPLVRFFERFGFFWGLLSGAVLVPVSILLFKLAKAIYIVVGKENKRKERRQSRAMPGGLEKLNSEV